MKGLMLLLVGICSSFGYAQEQNLFSEQARQREAARVQDVRSRLYAEDQRLVAGMARVTRGMAPIDYATAKCSDGWQNSDYDNQVEQICNSQGCVGFYARHPEDYHGSVFTCHFNLTNGSQCFVQAYLIPKTGFSGRCVDTALKDHPINIVVGPGIH